MALRDQPYLPLYVQDFMTDEKLAECSAMATGVYIRLMCIMHKSEDYGKICYNKRDNKTENKALDFAKKLSKQMPYSTQEIYDGLRELLELNIIQIFGEKLIQKRMVRDGELSEKRAKSGKKGMKNRYKSIDNIKSVCYNKTYNKSTNKNVTNTENEIEYENETEIVVETEKGGMGEKTKIPFETVWELYEKKGNRKTSEKKWGSLKNHCREAALKHIPLYVASTPDKQYRKNFETYLHQECWNDEILTKNKPNGNTGIDENFMRGIAAGYARGISED